MTVEEVEAAKEGVVVGAVLREVLVQTVLEEVDAVRVEADGAGAGARVVRLRLASRVACIAT